MNERLDEFLSLSADLTGFGRDHLLGTGVAQEYLQTLENIVPQLIVERLFGAYGSMTDEDLLVDQLRAQILENVDLGPVARNIMVLWYCGSWSALPESWCERNGRSSRDVGHVVSTAAYLAGLQWSAMGSHPPGALPPGFGSWAVPPLGVDA